MLIKQKIQKIRFTSTLDLPVTLGYWRSQRLMKSIAPDFFFAVFLSNSRFLVLKCERKKSVNDVFFDAGGIFTFIFSAFYSIS